jgi:hypothetical protein
MTAEDENLKTTFFAVKDKMGFFSRYLFMIWMMLSTLFKS